MFKEFQEALASGDLNNVVTSTVGQIIIWLIVIGLLVITLFVVAGKESSKYRVKELTYSGIAMGIATVLSSIKLFNLPQGGSVTACSMIAIVVIGYFYGLRQGVTCGFAFGLIQLALGASVMHPIQLLLDYPLAYAALGISGIFAHRKKGLALGLITGAFLRFLCHFISGVVFFASFAPEGWNPVLYSFVYNISYIGAEVLITLVIILIPQVENSFRIIKKNAIA